MVSYKDNRMSMLLVATMQLMGALFTEIINIYLICSLNTVADILVNYIALGVIAEIDNIYAKTLQHNPLRKMIADGYSLTYDEKKPSRSGYLKRWNVSAMFYKMIKMFYECYYFYFMGFTVVGLTFSFVFVF